RLTTAVHLFHVAVAERTVWRIAARMHSQPWSVRELRQSPVLLELRPVLSQHGAGHRPVDDRRSAVLHAGGIWLRPLPFSGKECAVHGAAGDPHAALRCDDGSAVY